MKSQKGVLSRLFNRRSAEETKAPDLNDLTAHLAIDPDAISSRAGEPAFMAPPVGAQPYHGFRLLPEVEVAGFTFGKITNFLRYENLETGDAPPTSNRWGVWMVGFTQPMDSLDAALANLASIQPGLEDRWRRWHEARSQGKFD